jgi:hypothetical protein
MRVLSLLDEARHRALCDRVPDSWIVRHASYREALTDVRSIQTAAIVLHPEDLAGSALHALIDAAGTNGSRVVLFGDPATVGARQLIEPITNVYVEFVSISHSGALAVASVIAMPARSIPVRVLAAIGSRVLRMPPRYSIPTIRLFTYDDPPRRPKDFFARIGRSQTAVGRAMAAAGLAPPSTLLNISKIARGIHLIQLDYSYRDAASAAHLASPQRLRELVRSVAAELLDGNDHALSPQEIAERLITRATNGGIEGSGPADVRVPGAASMPEHGG